MGSPEQKVPRHVVVAGDVTIDWNLARTRKLHDSGAAGSKDEFLLLLERADEVIELPARTNREEAYEAVGDAVLERADVLLAIWDGQGAQGQGGTGEVVARACARAIPIAWVHAGNRKPGTMEATALGSDQGHVTYERL